MTLRLVSQAHWRMHACSSRFQRSRHSIIVLQSLARMHFKRHSFLQVRQSTSRNENAHTRLCQESRLGRLGSLQCPLRSAKVTDQMMETCCCLNKDARSHKNELKCTHQPDRLLDITLSSLPSSADEGSGGLHSALLEGFTGARKTGCPKGSRCGDPSTLAGSTM